MTEIYQIPDEDKKALETLFANLQFITLSKELIYRNDDYYNISISGIGVCLARVGTIPLFLGEILQLWEQTQWLKNGEYCYFIMGTPRPDNNICHFWSEKDGFATKSVKKMSDLALPAFSLVNDGVISYDLNIRKPSAAPKTESKLSIYDLIERIKI